METSYGEDKHVVTLYYVM